MFELYSDHANVVKKYNAWPTPNQLWRDIDALHAKLGWSKIWFDVRKVKAHGDEGHIEAGITTEERKYGNNRADHYTKKGAAIYELTDRQLDWVSKQDAQA